MVEEIDKSLSKLQISPQPKNILNPKHRKALIQQGKKELSALFSQISNCEPSQSPLSESARYNDFACPRSSQVRLNRKGENQVPNLVKQYSQVEESSGFKKPMHSQRNLGKKFAVQNGQMTKAETADYDTDIFAELVNDALSEESKKLEYKPGTTQNSFLNTTSSISLINHTLNPYNEPDPMMRTEFKEQIEKTLTGTSYSISNLVEIKQLRKQVTNGKIELMCGRIESIEELVDLTNFKLQDGTGEVEGCLHRDCLSAKLNKDFQIGSYILLESVDIFYPFPEHPLFLVEERNIVKIRSEKKGYSDLF